MVTSSPIPFAEITRQAGTNKANPPVADALYATDIDNDFAAINAWLNSRPMSLWKATVFSTLVTFTTGFQPAAAQPINYGYALQDVRYLCMRTTYVGANVNGGANGAITPIRIGTLPAGFIAGLGNYFFMPCQIGVTTGAIVHTLGGELYLGALSYDNQVLATNTVISVTHTYIVRGAT